MKGSVSSVMSKQNIRSCSWSRTDLLVVEEDRVPELRRAPAQQRRDILRPHVGQHALREKEGWSGWVEPGVGEAGGGEGELAEVGAVDESKAARNHGPRDDLRAQPRRQRGPLPGRQHHRPRDAQPRRDEERHEGGECGLLVEEDRGGGDGQQRERQLAA